MFPIFSGRDGPSQPKDGKEANKGIWIPERFPEVTFYYSTNIHTYIPDSTSPANIIFYILWTFWLKINYVFS
jgi:hypothetical protein